MANKCENLIEKLNYSGSEFNPGEDDFTPVFWDLHLENNFSGPLQEFYRKRVNYYESIFPYEISPN